MAPADLDRLLQSPRVNAAFREALTAPTRAPARHKGAVEVTIEVWAVYSGDGPNPRSNPTNPPEPGEGEMYPQWYYQGEKSLAEVRTDPEVRNYASIFDATGNPLSNPIARDSFVLYPAEQDLVVAVRVYDKDEIGDQSYKEVSEFLGNVGAQTANLYPESTTVIPVLQELAQLLVLDLPNLFLENDPLGTLRFTVLRSSDGVLAETKWVKENHLVARVSVVPK
jgi:hypothetical protein